MTHPRPLSPHGGEGEVRLFDRCLTGHRQLGGLRRPCRHTPCRNSRAGDTTTGADHSWATLRSVGHREAEVSVGVSSSALPAAAHLLGSSLAGVTRGCAVLVGPGASPAGRDLRLRRGHSGWRVRALLGRRGCRARHLGVFGHCDSGPADGPARIRHRSRARLGCRRFVRPRSASRNGGNPPRGSQCHRCQPAADWLWLARCRPDLLAETEASPRSSRQIRPGGDLPGGRNSPHFRHLLSFRVFTY